MSNIALTWAFAQATGNPGRKAVLVALADKADDQHSCFPKQSTLARMTDQSERSVRGHLLELERAGLIRRDHRYAQGHRLADRYVLPVSVAARVVPANSASSKPAGSAGSAASEPADSARVNRQDLPRSNPKEQPSPPPTVVGDATKILDPADDDPATIRGHRLPADWRRTPADVAWQQSEGIPDEFARPVTAEFVNYWLAATRNAAKRNWSRAWRTWLSKEWRRDGARWQRDHPGHGPDRSRAAAARARAADPLASAR